MDRLCIQQVQRLLQHVTTPGRGGNRNPGLAQRRNALPYRRTRQAGLARQHIPTHLAPGQSQQQRAFMIGGNDTHDLSPLHARQAADEREWMAMATGIPACPDDTGSGLPDVPSATCSLRTKPLL